MEVKLENAKASPILDEDLELATGGSAVSIKKDGLSFVYDFSCPKCGCKDLEGIEEGKVYYQAIDIKGDIIDKQIVCKNCGYTNKGSRFSVK